MTTQEIKPDVFNLEWTVRAFSIWENIAYYGSFGWIVPYRFTPKGMSEGFQKAVNAKEGKAK